MFQKICLYVVPYPEKTFFVSNNIPFYSILTKNGNFLVLSFYHASFEPFNKMTRGNSVNARIQF